MFAFFQKLRSYHNFLNACKTPNQVKTVNICLASVHVASVSMGLGSQKRQRNGIFGILQGKISKSTPTIQ